MRLFVPKDYTCSVFMKNTCGLCENEEVPGLRSEKQGKHLVATPTYDSDPETDSANVSVSSSL